MRTLDDEFDELLERLAPALALDETLLGDDLRDDDDPECFEHEGCRRIL